MKHHIKKGRKFNRSLDHRHALLRNLFTSLIMNGKLTTTLAKAKELKSFSDSQISRAKEADFSTRRKIFSLVTKKEVAQKLFDETLTGLKDQNFGFTRVVKLGRRLSDGAEMARIELVGGKNEDKNS